MDDHKTVAGLIKEALDRYLAERRARGEPTEAHRTGLWMHLAFALLVAAIYLYFLFV